MGLPARANDRSHGADHFVSDISVYMDSGTGTSTGLLQRALLRQPDAWNKLVSLYGPLVYWWCRRWGLQPSDAENVGQEVFMRVFEQLPAFRGGGQNFRGWILQIARNCFLNHVRERKSETQATGGSDGQHRLAELPAARVEQADDVCEVESLLLRQAISLLHSEFSSRDVDAFSQLVFSRRQPAEVAAAMNVSTSVVYRLKSRVLRRLREEFAELIDL